MHNAYFTNQQLSNKAEVQEERLTAAGEDYLHQAEYPNHSQIRESKISEYQEIQNIRISQDVKDSVKCKYFRAATKK